MTYKIYTENSTQLIDAPTLQDALTIFKQTSEAEVIAVLNMDKTMSTLPGKSLNRS